MGKLRWGFCSLQMLFLAADRPFTTETFGFSPECKSPGLFSQCLIISLENFSDVGTVRVTCVLSSALSQTVPKSLRKSGQFFSKDDTSSSTGALYLCFITFSWAVSLIERSLNAPKNSGATCQDNNISHIVSLTITNTFEKL